MQPPLTAFMLAPVRCPCSVVTCHLTLLVDILLQLNMYSARLTSSTPGSTVLGYAYEPWDIQVCH